MSQRFQKVGNERLTATDGPSCTFPGSDYTFAFVLIIEPGSYGGSDPQVLFSTGGLASGAINVLFMGPGYASGPLNVAAQFSTSSSYRFAKAGVMAEGGKYLCAMQRVGTTLRWKICPILDTAPVDGSAVVTNDVSGFSLVSSGYDGPGPLTIGARADLASTRHFDNSVARVFRVPGLLTDHELARLANGETIFDLGYTPDFYFPLDDANDLRDRGTDANVLAKSGAAGGITTGSAPGFGYVEATPSPADVTSAPAINGTPAVGVAVGLTPGAVAGYPAPTVLYQWMLDGADVDGATGSTYTPAAGDAGKTLAVRQRAVNATGDDSMTSTGKVVTVEAVITYSVNEIANYRVFQRSAGKADVPLSGLCGPQVAVIEAQVRSLDGATVLQAWTPLTGLNIVGDAWSGAVAANQSPAWCRIEVRFKSSSGTVLATTPLGANRWAVGAIFGTGGSSSAEGWMNTGTYAETGVSARFKTAWAAQPTGGNGVIVEFCNAMYARLGVVIGVVYGGVSGTTLSDWNRSSSAWTAFSGRVADVGGKLEGMLFTAGSNDAAEGLGSVPDVATHAANLRKMFQRLRDLVGQPAMPIFLSGFNRRDNAHPVASDYVRMAENLVGGDPGIYHTQTLDLPLQSDLTHLTGAGYRTAMQRLTYVADGVYAGAGGRRGPRITAIAYSGARFRVSLEHRSGNDFTPAVGSSGFTAGDATGALTVTGVTRLNATAIEVTADREIGSGAWLKHLSGNMPDVTAPTLDNGAVPLPLLVETSVPAVYSDTAPPDPIETGIDASKVPASRTVIFAGGIRIVRF